MTSTSCYPWWHAEYRPLQAAPQIFVSSGCATAGGNVQCSPESMRANAEAKLRELGVGIDLSLEGYTLARYMQAEVGNGTLEERIAVGEAAVNRAKLGKLPKGVISLLLERQGVGHPNFGYYGPIHGGSGVTSAPYGRWASTSVDPTVLTILLAQLVASGASGNFARGADDQDGLEYTAAFPDPAAKVRYAASKGNYWVGPLPGVDHWRTFLWRFYGVKPDSAEGAPLLQLGLEAVADRTRPVWPTDMPTCARPGTGLAIGLGIGAMALGAWLTTRDIKLPWSS